VYVHVHEDVYVSVYVYVDVHENAHEHGDVDGYAAPDPDLDPVRTLSGMAFPPMFGVLAVPNRRESCLLGM